MSIVRGAYYNEIDPFAAAWLRHLISNGHIAAGDVDERDIRTVHPSDLTGFTQCHFFAGIGVWSHALRQAGWPDDQPVWTGSCPCQPFSAAGKGKGSEDERHLWPYWDRLIEQCRPPVVFGEQVAAAIGHGWLDLVQSDLERKNYAVGKAVLGACSVGAPHIRQRLYFVADTERELSNQRRSDLGGETRGVESETQQRQRVRHVPGSSGHTCNLADTDRGQCNRIADGQELLSDRQATRRNQSYSQSEPDSTSGILADDHDERRPGPTNGFWGDADWLFCRDGRWRPVEPGTLPLAHGAPARVGRLRGYGNAICAEVAKEFINAYLESSVTQVFQQV